MISTLNGVLAGARPPVYFAKNAAATLIAGRPRSLAYLAGAPGAFAAPANTALGVALSSSSALVAGQLPHVDPGSGNSYLSRFSAIATQPGVLLLCDRLMQVAGNSAGTAISVTSTSAQTINSAALPARDNAASVNGDGVLWGMEIVGVTGAGAGNAPTLSSYTNQAGTAAHSAGLIDTYGAASVAGDFYRFGLQAGDTGIKSVESFTNSATMTSGTIALVAYRVLAVLELPAASVGNSIDAITSGFPLLPNGVVPFLIFIPNTTTTTNISGQYVETQG